MCFLLGCVIGDLDYTMALTRLLLVGGLSMMLVTKVSLVDHAVVGRQLWFSATRCQLLSTTAELSILLVIWVSGLADVTKDELVISLS